MHHVTVEREDGGDHFSADEVVVNQEDRRKFVLFTDTEHACQASIWPVLRVDPIPLQRQFRAASPAP